jgi:cell division septation protein DedD
LVDRTAKPGEHENIEETRENALRELKQMLEDAGVDNSFETENGKPKSKVFPILATVLTLILLINVVLFLQKNPQAAKQTEIAKMDMAAALSDDIDSSIGNTKTSELNPVNENLQTINTPQIAINLLFNPGFAISKNEFEFDSTAYFSQFDLLQLAKPEEIKITPEISNTEPIFEPKKVAIVNPSKPEKVATNSLELNTHSEKSPTKEQAEPLPLVNTYHLIVGAFGNYENAQKLLNELNEKGFKEAQLIPAKKKGMTLVSLQTVSSETEASDLKASLESQGIESWVFPKN